MCRQQGARRRRRGRGRRKFRWWAPAADAVSLLSAPVKRGGRIAADRRKRRPDYVEAPREQDSAVVSL